MSKQGIVLKDVSRSYKDADRTLTVLDKVSHHFEPETSYAIVGRSGVGKSTFLHLLGGLDKPTEGSLSFFGEDITTYSTAKLAQFRGMNVGFVFQFHHLLAEFTAAENVAMPLFIAGKPRAEALEKASSLLERVGLAERVHHVPGMLSGGEQQRVALARALCPGPRAVLADEPTGSLDHKTSDEMVELLMDVCQENAATLIVVTHSLQLASRMKTMLNMEPGGALVEQSLERNN